MYQGWPGILRWAARCALAAILLPLLHQPLAQQTPHTRVFRFGAEPPSAISIGPRGTVWVRHGDTARISGLDGYTVREITAPESGSFRVVESRSGQLWSCYSQGLLLYDRNEWVRHPISLIATELQQNPLRQLRQISLVPAEVNRVFFLLSGSLYEFDAYENVVRPIAHASNLGLGRFAEMQEARDGTLLISAEGGLLRSTVPLRQLNSVSTWQKLPFPEGTQIENVQRPFEDSSGSVVLLGAFPGSSADRVVGTFQDGEWRMRILFNERLKQAWRAWDGSLWAYSYNSLLRLGARGSPINPAVQREVVIGAQYDIAVETNGVFWIATSDGLTRYGPPLWQVPLPARSLNTPVHGIVFETPDRFWAAATEGLYFISPDNVAVTPWPENLESVGANPRGLFQLRDGRLALALPRQTILFQPATSGFSVLQHPSGAPMEYLGKVDGAAAFAVLNPANEAANQVELFDGEFKPLFTREDLAPFGDELFFVSQTRSGDVWIGGTGGLGYFSQIQQRFTYYDSDVGLPTGRIIGAAEVSENRHWFATQDQIIEFDGSFFRSIYFSSDRIFALHRTRAGKVWVGTSSGALRLEKGAFLRHELEEGLPSVVTYGLVDDTLGRLWAATARGVARFAPEADMDPPRTSAPILRNPESPIVDGAATVFFSALDRWSYTPAGDLLFSWRVDEGPWSGYTNSAVAVVENIRHGPHRFEVRAIDRNGNEDPSPAILEFAVALPWHNDPRLLAVSLAGAALILALAAVAVNRHLRLLRSYAEVERIVAQRTRELEKANEELLHSQKMKALGTLAAGIAHDFNNILSIIKGSAQIIEANPHDTNKVQTRLNRIRMMVDQGSGIVRSMLGLGRLSEKETVRVFPTKLVEDTVKALSEKIPPQIVVVVEQDPEIGLIKCHKDLLQQILLNLLLNAVDAVVGPGSIRVRMDWTDSPGELSLAPAAGERYFNLYVEDTGHGISEEAMTRIFEPFFTTKAMSSRRGTGLGLSMVYELAKGMGYGIGVSSTPGQGTTFRIVIPQPASEPGSAPQPALTESAVERKQKELTS